MRKVRLMPFEYFAGVIFLILLFPANSQLNAGENESSLNTSKNFFQSIDEIEPYYRITGTDQDTIVIIHGGPGLRICCLRPDLELFNEEYTIICYDQRSAGRSTVEIDYSLLHIDKYIEDFEAVRCYFRFYQLNMLGHSWGAFLGARFTHKYPDNVSLLVMVCPGPIRLHPYDAMFFPHLKASMDNTKYAQFDSLHKVFVADRGIILEVCRKFTNIFKRWYWFDPTGQRVVTAGPEAIIRSFKTIRHTKLPLFN